MLDMPKGGDPVREVMQKQMRTKKTRSQRAGGRLQPLLHLRQCTNSYMRTSCTRSQCTHGRW